MHTFHFNISVFPSNYLLWINNIIPDDFQELIKSLSAYDKIINKKFATIQCFDEKIVCEKQIISILIKNFQYFIDKGDESKNRDRHYGYLIYILLTYYPSLPPTYETHKQIWALFTSEYVNRISSSKPIDYNDNKPLVWVQPISLFEYNLIFKFKYEKLDVEDLWNPGIETRNLRDDINLLGQTLKDIFPVTITCT